MSFLLVRVTLAIVIIPPHVSPSDVKLPRSRKHIPPKMYLEAKAEKRTRAPMGPSSFFGFWLWFFFRLLAPVLFPIFGKILILIRMPSCQLILPISCPHSCRSAARVGTRGLARPVLPRARARDLS